MIAVCTEIHMAEFAVVRGAGKTVSGLWLAHPSMVYKRDFLLAILKKVEASQEVIDLLMSGDYRMVSNTFDGRGGVFVMFGSAQAPHEARITGTGKRMQ